MSAAIVVTVLGCSRKSGSVEPGKFEDFVTKVGPGGITPPPNCSRGTEGKAYALEGFLHLANNMTLDGRKTNLEFFRQNNAEGDGAGDSFQVKVSLGDWLNKGDIDDLWESAKNVKARAYKVQEGEIEESALRIQLADGSVAGAKDKIRLSVEIEVIPNINPKAPAACEYIFISATKL
jgi:hypothetical protein